MINVNGIKRNAKNIVKKYSYAQVKVREATSNDPWGPSSTIMAEIADLTYNVVAFSEIMQMIWKRLNDHGKNWRHVYKALVVLEYLIKTGTEKVAQQCIENIFAIQTLKDFQYMEENKDFGMNIREKSKKLVALLKDTEKLKAERARALKAKSRLAESLSSVGKTSLASMMSSSGSIGSSGGDNTTPKNTTTPASAAAAAASSNGNSYLNYHNDSGSSSSGAAQQLTDVGALAILGHDIDSARPQTLTEEEQQLKLALALSKEEADQQEKTRKNDELRLKLALDVSKKTANTSPNLLDDFASGPSTSAGPPPVLLSNVPAPAASRNTIDDLLGLSIPAPEPTPAPQSNTISSILQQASASSSLSTKIPVPQNDPWSVDPWQTPMPIQPPVPSTQPQFNINISSPLTMPSNLTTALPTITSIQATNQTTNVFNAKRLMSKNPFED